MEDFVLAIYGAYYINTKRHFLEELKRRGITFFNSKTVEEKQDPTENDQYYLVNSDLLVVVVDDPRDAKTLRDIMMVLDYVRTTRKPVIFVLSNFGEFDRERDAYYASVDVLLKTNGIVNPIRSLDDAIVLIEELRRQKIEQANAENVAE